MYAIEVHLTFRRLHSAMCFSCVNQRPVGILTVCRESKVIALANHIRCKHFQSELRTNACNLR